MNARKRYDAKKPVFAFRMDAGLYNWLHSSAGIVGKMPKEIVIEALMKYLPELDRTWQKGQKKEKGSFLKGLIK